MKRLIAMVAVAAGLMIAGAANAAQVDVKLTQTAAGSSDWALTVNNNGAVGVGALNFELVGLNVLTVNAANTAISALDSAINVDAFGPGDHFVVINNNPGQSIAPASTLGTLIATFSGATSGVQLIAAETNAGSATVYDASGNPTITDFSLTVIPAPEPATMLLLGVGLAGMAFARRRTA